MKDTLLIFFFLFNISQYNCLLGKDSISSQADLTQVESTNGVTSAEDDSAEEPEESKTIIQTPLTRLEFYLSVIVLIFGLIVVIIEIILIKTGQITSESSIKFTIITIIIISTLFLITAGYSNDQIAPAMGLLGTIAGYILGKNNNSN